MAKKQIIINEEQAKMLSDTIQDRCVELEKVATGLMKKHLPDAANPVYVEIRRLQKMKETLDKDVSLAKSE